MAAPLVLAALAFGASELRAQVKKDEAVVFFPTAGHLASGGRTWIAPIHAWVYEPERDSVARAAVLGLFRRALGLSSEEAATGLFRARAWPFLVDNERGKTIVVRIAAKEYTIGESEANGHVTGEVRIPLDAVPSADTARRWVSFQAITREGDERLFSGRVELLAETGLSVISDIDDTIKISHVTDPEALLRSTFLREFEAVPGMARVYRRWAESGASVHYVSASPWQLYTPLDDFLRDSGFPAGSVSLKYFSWKDRSFFSLLASPEKTKRRALEPLLKTFPQRRFILVGDSGQEDPEIYGKIARDHPQQVSHVFIRNVTEERPDQERFRRAFDGLPRNRWTLFSTPAEIESVPVSAVRDNPQPQ